MIGYRPAVVLLLHSHDGDPNVAVLCAMRAASLDEVAWVRCVRRVIVAISAFAVFAVLTNNVHHFIFAFDFADPDWGGNYRYAFGYYVLVAWYIVLFVIFFATLFLSARRISQHAFSLLALSLALVLFTV